MKKKLFEIFEILLLKEGFSHLPGQPLPNNTTNEIRHFIKDGELIEIPIEPEANEDILKTIKGENYARQ